MMNTLLKNIFKFFCFLSILPATAMQANKNLTLDEKTFNHYKKNVCASKPADLVHRLLPDSRGKIQKYDFEAMQRLLQKPHAYDTIQKTIHLLEKELQNNKKTCNMWQNALHRAAKDNYDYLTTMLIFIPFIPRFLTVMNEEKRNKHRSAPGYLKFFSQFILPCECGTTRVVAREKKTCHANQTSENMSTQVPSVINSTAIPLPPQVPHSPVPTVANTTLQRSAKAGINFLLN